MEGQKTFKDLAVPFQPGLWQPAAAVVRPFVRYPNFGASPGVVWQYLPESSPATLSVVIPTADAYRGGYLPKLLTQINCQDFSDFELIVVRGDPRQGRAINIGAALAQGKYLLTLDDDTSLPDPETFSKLVTFMEAHPEIGIAGGNNVIPADASPFVRRVMQELPRRSGNPVQEITDSDLAEHPCMIMRTTEFKAVGGENELLPRGLDPYLRQAFREAGLRVVVVPGVIYHHLPPDSWDKLLKQFFRNGRQAAYCNKLYPQWVIETPNKHQKKIQERVSLPFRMVRYVWRILKGIITFRWIYVLASLSYLMGFIWEYLTLKNQPTFTK